MRQKSLVLSKLWTSVPAPSVATGLKGKQGGAGTFERPAQGGGCSGAALGAMPSLVSLHILINYLERRGLVNSKLIKFSDDANSGGFLKTGKGRGNINGTWMG